MSAVGTVGRVLPAPRPDAPGQTGDDALVGHTTISAKALKKVVSAVAAHALGVRTAQIGTDIADDTGNLSMTVRAPIRIAPLRARGAEPVPSAPTILDRATEAQHTIRAEVEQLTGSRISRVEVRITGAQIEQEGRVQ